MSNEERIILLENFVSLLADATYNANSIAQASIQLLIKKKIITHNEAAEMRKNIEKNARTLTILKSAIDSFNNDVEIAREESYSTVSDDEIKNFVKKVFYNFN